MTASSKELTAHRKSSILGGFDEQNSMRTGPFQDLNIRTKRLSESHVTFGGATSTVEVVQCFNSAAQPYMVHFIASADQD
jgi:hypothetical protein